MKIKWEQQLSVVENKIDAQHKNLLKQIENLRKLSMREYSRDDMLEALDFLSTYIKEHLDYEEKYMLKNRYPGYYEHKKIHTQFKTFYSKFKSQILLGEISKDKLKGEIESFLGSWWIFHIGQIDHQYCEYISANCPKKKSLNSKKSKL